MLPQDLSKFNIQSWTDYVRIRPQYEEILRSTEGFLTHVESNSELKEFHKRVAQHSLIYQAWSHGTRYGQNYAVDVGLYVRGGGEFIVNMDSSKALSDFKVAHDGTVGNVWRDQVRRNVNTFRPLFFSNANPDEVYDFSPIYLAEWVLDDWFEIEAVVPDAAENVLDIGCGVGAQNILINQMGSRKRQFTLIDTDVDALRAAQRLLSDNGLKVRALNTIDQYDLIISLRSCCFLYGFEEYQRIFRDQTKTGSVIIVDISHDRLEETLTFFGSFCSTRKSLIQDGATNHRYVFVR